MTDIDFRNRIHGRRCYSSSPARPLSEHELIRVFESDRGRIVNSPAIRRLQQKTQVFPLERNAAVRTRLTHSLEVQQVGRYIAKEVLSRLKEQDLLVPLGLETLTGPFESMVEMACLMHDIGNPPFGHFGESAINDWFGRRLGLANEPGDGPDRCQPVALRTVAGDEQGNALRRQMREDLCHFEGNAQGVRLVHSLLRMNLTYSQVGCVLKYTRPAWFADAIPASHRYLMKKPGFYLSEAEYILQLRKELQLDEYCRFPLTWIMEAADDISYCIADLEDAVEKHIFTTPQLYRHLEDAWGQDEQGGLFSQTVRAAWNKANTNQIQRSVDEQFFMYLRVYTLNNLVPYAAQRFIDNIEQIYRGDFNQALLEDGSPYSQLLEMYKVVAVNHVFNHRDVEQLELQGDRVIRGLLDIYRPLLDMPVAEFQRLVAGNDLRGWPIETRLYHKLSTRYCLAYTEAVSAISADGERWASWEFYYRCRLIQDYISGMTDLYAWDEYRRLMAVE